MTPKKSEFSHEVCGIIDEFKRIYRSNKPNYQNANLTLEEFDINRKKMRTYSDKELYQTIEKVIEKIDKLLDEPNSRLYNHSGLRDFTEELANTLANYKIQNNNAIHIGRTAARIQLNVIQMLSSVIQKPSAAVETDVLKQVKLLNHLKHEDTIKQLSISFNSLRDHNHQLYSRIQEVIR